MTLERQAALRRGYPVSRETKNVEVGWNQSSGSLEVCLRGIRDFAANSGSTYDFWMTASSGEVCRIIKTLCDKGAETVANQDGASELLIPLLRLSQKIAERQQT